jgi:hypothetical protein
LAISADFRPFPKIRRRLEARTVKTIRQSPKTRP